MLWELPTFPLFLSDEFNFGSVPGTVGSPWTRYGSGTFDDVNAIDPYAAVVDPNGARQDYTASRHSWYLVQPSGTDPTAVGIVRSVVWPANCFVWARLAAHARLGTAWAQPHWDGLCLIEIGSTTAGLPDEQNLFFCGFNISDIDNEIACEANYAIGGVYGAGLYHGPNTRDYSQPDVYVGIQKRGDLYSGWVAGSGGSWVHLLTADLSTATTPLDSLAIGFRNRSTNPPGALIVGVDFVRAVSGVVLP